MAARPGSAPAGRAPASRVRGAARPASAYPRADGIATYPNGVADNSRYVARRVVSAQAFMARSVRPLLVEIVSALARARPRPDDPREFTVDYLRGKAPKPPEAVVDPRPHQVIGSARTQAWFDAEVRLMLKDVSKELCLRQPEDLRAAAIACVEGSMEARDGPPTRPTLHDPRADALREEEAKAKAAEAEAKAEAEAEAEATLPLKVGDEVQCRFGGRGKWYAGTLTAVNADGTFNVEYKDGDSDDNVKPDWVRRWVRPNIKSGFKFAG